MIVLNAVYSTLCRAPRREYRGHNQSALQHQQVGFHRQSAPVNNSQGGNTLFAFLLRAYAIFREGLSERAFAWSQCTRLLFAHIDIKPVHFLAVPRSIKPALPARLVCRRCVLLGFDSSSQENLLIPDIDVVLCRAPFNESFAIWPTSVPTRCHLHSVCYFVPRGTSPSPLVGFGLQARSARCAPSILYSRPAP